MREGEGEEEKTKKERRGERGEEERKRKGIPNFISKTQILFCFK